MLLQITSNRSLDGVLDTLNSRNMTDAGPLQLIDHEDKVGAVSSMDDQISKYRFKCPFRNEVFPHGINDLPFCLIIPG